MLNKSHVQTWLFHIYAIQVDGSITVIYNIYIPKSLKDLSGEH